MEAPGPRPTEPAPGHVAPDPDPAWVALFVNRCLRHGWDEGYARTVSRSHRVEAALRRCREATWAAGRDAQAREAVSALGGIPTPGGCYPDEATMLSDAFFDGLAVAAEAVVARDLLDPADFDTLLATWRAQFGDLA